MGKEETGRGSRKRYEDAINILHLCMKSPNDV